MALPVLDCAQVAGSLPCLVAQSRVGAVNTCPARFYLWDMISRRLCLPLDYIFPKVYHVCLTIASTFSADLSSQKVYDTA